MARGRSWVLVRHRRGWFSPSWFGRLSGPVRWVVNVVVVGIGLTFLAAIVASPPQDDIPLGQQWLVSFWEWLAGHDVIVVACTALGALLLAGWWWAIGDGRMRDDLRRISQAGQLTLPACDLTADDLLPDRSRTDPSATFLPRQLRRFEQPQAIGVAVIDAVPWLLPSDGGRGKRIALVGSAGMGKTRLAHELIQQLPSETIVFVPDRGLQNRNSAELERSTRYLRGKACVLVFDDLNYYVGRTKVAEIAEVVARQARQHAIIVTCTTSTLPQVRSDADPALSGFFAALDQYEVVRMTDNQMETLAAGPAGEHASRVPSECGGNQGSLLFDFQRLHEEFERLSAEERATVEAIHALFVAGISPIGFDQVRGLAESGFGATLDTPTIRGALERLRSMTFVREVEPVIPEEAYLSEMVGGEAAQARIREIEEVLEQLGDARGLFRVGAVTYHLREDFESASRAWRLAAELNRATGGAEGLVQTAMALAHLGLALNKWGRPPEEVEDAYRDAAAAGRDADSAEGLVQTTRALFELGDALSEWGRPEEEVEGAYRDAAAAGREAGTPEGLVHTAMALSNLGLDLARWERPQDEVEGTYRDAAAAGREAGTPEGLVHTATALFNLGLRLTQWGCPEDEIERAYRSAAAAGREADTSEGLVQTATALFNLGLRLTQWERPQDQVEGAYRDVAVAGREAASPEGLVLTAKALSNLGIDLRQWGRPQDEVERVYRDAAAAGREAGTPEGLVQTANALFNLGLDFGRWERPEDQVEDAYREAAAAGRESDTPEGLVLTATALFNLGNALGRWERPQREIEDTCRDAAAAGRAAGTPEGLVLTAMALSNLGVALGRWERSQDAVEGVYRDAAAAGREADAPEGLVQTARALFNFGVDLARWERPQDEVEHAYRDAAAAGREAGTPEGAEAARRVDEILGEGDDDED